MDMIKNFKFKRVNNKFQSNLGNDIRQIRRSNNLFISADKSRNIYKVKLVMNKRCTKMIQKHTKNVIPINLTL